jgi:predicted deacylase
MESYKVNCGQSMIPLKIFDSGPVISPGPTVLVTAGMDGDEYVGIQAAQWLVKAFTKTKPIKGRIVIIPLVNVPGFKAKMSWNPHDLVYPKHVYPGNPKGTETEQLISWIASQYIYTADYWIDLHGGATYESLIPFVWGYQTKSDSVNKKTQHVLQATRAPICVFQKNYTWGKVETLAGNGCSYCVFECGERGVTSDSDVKQIVLWTERVLEDFGLLVRKKEIKTGNPSWFSEVHEYLASKEGWNWNPSITVGEIVEKGQILGMLQQGDTGAELSVRARQDGKILWYTLEGTCHKNTVLVALAKP